MRKSRTGFTLRLVESSFKPGCGIAVKRNSHAAGRAAPAGTSATRARIDALNAELAQLRRMVHVDHLTGALNRRGLDEAYAREASRADRHTVPLGAILLDLDDFKCINDTHGHHAGDAVLAHFARLAMRLLRPSDVVVRFGGEEFLLLLPESGLEQAAKALARLRADLERAPLIYEGRELPVRFSAGIAVRRPGESSDGLFARADRALYRAKGAGKNCQVTAD